MSKFESASLQKAVKSRLKSTFPENSKVIVGVSGGADSMALIYSMIKAKWVEPVAVHINYNKRGDNSDADQELVEEMCSFWGIECCSVRIEDQPDSNFQNWARDLRYQVFEDLKKEYEASGIAVAHHMDDQLETILHKILRGSGADNWEGLKSWNGSIFRPLVDFKKEEIYSFCEDQGIPFREDESNSTNSFFRNAVRNQVFPVFDEFIPGWQKNLVSVSEKSAVTSDLLDKTLNKVVSDNELHLELLSDFNLSTKKQLIKRFVELQTNQMLSKGEVHQLIGLIDSQVGKMVELGNHWQVIRNRDSLSCQMDSKKIVEIELSSDDLKSELSISQFSFKKENDLPSQFSKDVLILDVDKIDWPITLRNWRSGDHFIPFGMTGSQKVSDHLTNRKIKASIKQETLILIGSDGTIYAVLYPEVTSNGLIGCISELMKIENESTGSLKISLQQ